MASGSGPCACARSLLLNCNLRGKQPIGFFFNGRRSSSGRLVRTRRLTSITRDVRLNGRLWDLALDAPAA
jgi:hypothetical protein